MRVGRLWRRLWSQPRQNDWRLFVMVRPDGAAKVTLVNFADGVHKRLDGGQVSPNVVAFLQSNRVRFGSIKLASVVQCDEPTFQVDWQRHQPGAV